MRFKGIEGINLVVTLSRVVVRLNLLPQFPLLLNIKYGDE